MKNKRIDFEVVNINDEDVFLHFNVSGYVSPIVVRMGIPDYVRLKDQGFFLFQEEVQSRIMNESRFYEAVTDFDSEVEKARAVIAHYVKSS